MADHGESLSFNSISFLINFNFQRCVNLTGILYYFKVIFYPYNESTKIFQFCLKIMYQILADKLLRYLRDILISKRINSFEILYF